MALYFVQKPQFQAATRICSYLKHISAEVSMKQKICQSSMSYQYFHKIGSLLTSLINLSKSQHLLFLRKGFSVNFRNFTNFRIFSQIIFGKCENDIRENFLLIHVHYFLFLTTQKIGVGCPYPHPPYPFDLSLCGCSYSYSGEYCN